MDEAELLLGITLSTVTILETAHKIYEATSNKSGLRWKSSMLAEQSPLVYNTLELVEESLQAKLVTFD